MGGGSNGDHRWKAPFTREGCGKRVRGGWRRGATSGEEIILGGKIEPEMKSRCSEEGENLQKQKRREIGTVRQRKICPQQVSAVGKNCLE